MKKEEFLVYFRKCYKNARITIKKIDFNQEIVVELNNNFEVEINGYSSLNKDNFKGFSIWLYNRQNNQLVQHQDRIYSIDDLIYFIERYKLHYK